MLSDLDLSLLFAGLVRSLFWVIGFYFAYQKRSIAAAVGFAIASVTSTIFAFINAGADFGNTILTLGTSWGVITAVCMAVGISGRPDPPDRRWRL